MKVLGIVASTRPGSLNASLFDRLTEALEKKSCNVQQFDYSLAESMPQYSAQFEAESGVPADAQQLARSIAEADGVLIVTPEYNFSLPGTLKNLLDWVSRVRPWVLTRKPVLLGAASPSPVGGFRALSALRMPLQCMAANLVPYDVSLGTVADSSEVDERVLDDIVSERIEIALDMFIYLTTASMAQFRVQTH